ncbi:metal-sulfur cluster assembly factor [Savagea faecisuis]|uniref:Metal-sulfur cluster assembly factor n=1 Tax=Savagea faecisuis TaxID=1274803 RepID=A0ABW3GXD3_9BACL
MDEEMKGSMLGALENVIDPELGIDIVNLGLIYDVALDEAGVATVTMTLTSMGCPMGPQIVGNIKQELLELPEVKEVEVDVVWSPPWSKDMMSRYAKMALGVHG